MGPNNSFNHSFLLKYAAIPTAVLDKDLCYLSVSDSWMKHHGISEQDAIGSSIFKLFPNMGDQWKNIFIDTLKGNKHIEEDNVIVKNKKLHLQWTIVPWYDDSKQVGGIVLTLDDITEKYLLELRLKESNDRFKSAFQFSSIGMMIVSNEGKCLEANDQVSHILGYSREELYNLSFPDITHPEDLGADLDLFNRMIKGEIDFYNLEKRYIHKNGHVIWTLLGVSMIRNSKGAPLYLVSQILDRTDAKTAEEEIKKSKAHLQRIMDESPDIICNLTYEGIVLQINQACKEIWGYDPEELIGTRLTDLVFEEDLVNTKKTAEYIRLGKNLRNFENRYRKKDGTIVPMIWSIRGNNSDNTIFAIVQDATEKKRQEVQLNSLNTELEKKAKELSISNQYLQEFAFVASHDLQEPLRMISSFLDLLKNKYDPLLDDNGKKYIHFAVDGANRMQKMIMGLLEYSTIGNNNAVLENIDINILLKEAVDMNKYNINRKNALINWGNLPVIKGNQSMLLQLFHNLINNALKYQNENNRPEITITSSENEDEWIFNFSDNGIGIDKKYIEKIFTLFQRLHNRSEFSGSGIGLSICKRIVENHNGKIWVESSPGQGSNFSFTISKH